MSNNNNNSCHVSTALNELYNVKKYCYYYCYGVIPNFRWSFSHTEGIDQD